MQFQQLIKDASLTLAQGDPTTDIARLTDDSRQVDPGCAFIARAGVASDGSQFIQDAIDRGAAAIIASASPADLGLTVPADLLWAVGPQIDQGLTSRLAERFHNHPARTLKLIGITGTNGKTTTGYVTQALLATLGVKAGLLGTVIIDDGKERTPAELTTPGPIDTSAALARMVANGCQAAVMEVSSHALHQGRVGALAFDAAVFTNLTGDHLDYHGSMENYAAAKARLFEALTPEAAAVVNNDDAFAPRMLQDCSGRPIHCTVGNGHPAQAAVPQLDGVVMRATIHQLTAAGSDVSFVGPWGEVRVDLPLVGRHNVANVLQALAAAYDVLYQMGQPPEPDALAQALANAPSVPGRLEPVEVDADAAGELPRVLVDYAHTHDALENVLLALRPITTGQLICLFGCGGDRDATKRPRMAAVACKFADRIVITSDNPRTEDPHAIIDQIKAGVPDAVADRVTVEPDRRAAIEMAIQMADGRSGDVVLIAGKGHEDYQIIGTEKHHFDDREEAGAVLGRLAKI